MECLKQVPKQPSLAKKGHPAVMQFIFFFFVMWEDQVRIHHFFCVSFPQSHGVKSCPVKNTGVLIGIQSIRIRPIFVPFDIGTSSGKKGA
jgi:hypothetical protein